MLNKRGREITIMLASSQVCTEVLNRVIKGIPKKENTHNVFEFDRCDIRFLIQEIINPREVQPARDFTVRLDERWCDCGKF